MRTLLVLAMSVAATLYSQTITGDLAVTVTDPTGLAVSGAKLTLIQTETNAPSQAQSDSLGNVLFSQLQPGTYRLEVSAPGFRTANVTDIVTTIGQRAHVDAKLTVGSVSESVNVSVAAESLLNAESASVGQIINNQAIVELPLNGRNFI